MADCTFRRAALSGDATLDGERGAGDHVHMEAENRLGGGAGAAAPGLSRRALVAIAAVALLAGVLVALAVVASRSYGPLEFPGGLVAPRPVAGIDYRSVEPIDPAANPAYAVDAREPGAFGLAFEIQNRGRLPLTFEHAPRSRFMVLQQDVRISSVPLEVDPHVGRDVPIAGVTLDPGERRRLSVTFSWKAACSDDGGQSFMSPAGVEVRYSGLSVFHRTQTVEMPSSVVLVCGMDLRRLGDYIVQPPARG